MNVLDAEVGSLDSERLRLRALSERDIPRIVVLASDRQVAEGTLRIPHPYEESHAREFVERGRRSSPSAPELVFGIEERETDLLIGGCGVRIDPLHRNGEIGYWLGRAYWGRGLVSEAVGELIRWCFEDGGLDKLVALTFSWNVASARVLEKASFRREGALREHLIKWGRRQDVEQWGLLASEWRRDDGS